MRQVGLPRAVLAGCFAVLVTMGLLASSYGPLLPLIREQFSLSSVETGFLVSALPAGSIVAIIACARLETRVSARLLLQGSCAFLVVGLSGLALAPWWWLLLVSGVAIGLGYGGATTLANGVIAAAYDSRRSTFLLNLQNGIFGLGAVLGPVCVAVLPDGSGRLAWLGYVAVAVLAAVLFAALPLTSLASPERVSRAGVSQSEGLSPENVRSGSGLTALSPEKVRGVRSGSGRLGGFALLFACFVAVEISTAAWATTHLDAVGAGATAVALATSLFYLGLATGRLGAALIGLRVDPGPLLVGTTILATAALALTYLAPLGGAAYLLVGLTIGPVFPTGLAWVSHDQSHARHPIATVLVVGNLGGFMLPPLVGAVIAVLGAQAAPLPIAISCALGVVVAVSLFRGSRRSLPVPAGPLCV
ncbi:MAG: MFS transporter [Geodermatophilaceae bacterium]|nr:MFS transporter [Geodermatophilaceae bacterium]